jgi:hypothetical protein
MPRTSPNSGTQAVVATNNANALQVNVAMPPTTAAPPIAMNIVT